MDQQRRFPWPVPFGWFAADEDSLATLADFDFQALALSPSGAPRRADRLSRTLLADPLARASSFA